MLSSLPNEIISYILTFCNFSDLLSCQATCRFLNDLISNSPDIQYHIALQVSCMEDNPRCRLNIQDRLQLLKKREAAWCLFRPNFSQIIPVDQTTVVIYELSSGVYMLSGNTRDSISYLRLPTAEEEECPTNRITPRWIHIPIADELLDFGLAVTEHDLVGVLTTTTDDSSTILQIHYLQLSTGLRHPLAASPMQFVEDIRPENLGIGIEMVGDIAALVIRNASLGHNDRDKVLLLDWKLGVVRAELFTESRRYQSAIFLSPRVLLVTNASERCLEIWRIPEENDSAPKNPAVVLNLPEINTGFVVTEFACRGAPNPVYSSSNSETRPFSSCPAQSIMVFHLTMSPIDPRVPIPYIFFVHRRAFLDLLARAAELGPSPVPWSDWGPPVTRWLHARAVPTEWITTTAGQRYAFVSTHAPALPQPVVVFDFNPHHVRKFLKDKNDRNAPYHDVFETQEHEWKRIWLVDTPDSHENRKIFSERVGGRLPYVAIKSAKSYDFHGVLMDDERIIGIKRNHILAGVESIEVIHLG